MKIQSTRTMTTAISQNRNHFTMRSALAVCFLLSCIMSLQGFAATYYWVGNNAGDWDTSSSDWKTTTGASEAFDSTNTYVVDRYASIDGGTPTPYTGMSGTFAGGNLTVESGSGISVLATGTVSKLSLNGGQIARFGSGSRTVNSDQIILSGTTSEIAAANSSSGTTIGLTVSGPIEGSGNLRLKPGNSTCYVELTEENTHTGITYLTPRWNGGRLEISNAKALQSSTLDLKYDAGLLGTVNFNTAAPILGGLQDTGAAPANIDFQTRTVSVGTNNTDTTFDGVISNGSLTKIGTGTLTLNGNNTYTGNTTVEGGTLEVGGSGYLHSRASTSSATVKVDSGAEILLSTTSYNALGYGGSQTWSVDGTITNSSTSRQSLPGNVTLTNGALVGTGKFLTSTAYTTTITANGSANTISGGSIEMRDSVLTLDTPNGSDALSVSSVLVNDAASTTGSLTKTGDGTLILAGANTYSGGTTIAAGTLQLGNGGTTGSLGTGAVTNNGALVFNRSDIVAVTNDVSGTGSVEHAGSGTLELTGTLSYDGPTSVTGGGILEVASGSFGALSVGNGTLSIAGSGIGEIDLGANSLTLNDGAIIDWQFTDSTEGNYDQIVSTAGDLLGSGTITINVSGLGGYSVSKGDRFKLYDGNVSEGAFDSFAFVFSGDNSQYWTMELGSLDIVSTIPEPSTAILAGLGLAGMCLRRRKRT